MVNLPPELGSPDVWAGGGIGLIAGLLLRYFIVRVFIVFRLFGREWSFDLKDRGREDNHTDPPLTPPPKPPVRDGIGVSLAFCAIYEKIAWQSRKAVSIKYSPL